MEATTTATRAYLYGRGDANNYVNAEFTTATTREEAFGYFRYARARHMEDLEFLLSNDHPTEETEKEMDYINGFLDVLDFELS